MIRKMMIAKAAALVVSLGGIAGVAGCHEYHDEDRGYRHDPQPDRVVVVQQQPQYQPQPEVVYVDQPPVYEDRTVYVNREPKRYYVKEVIRDDPPPVREVRTPRPPDRDTWISGHQERRGGKWVLVPGHWEKAPQAGAHWVSGEWRRDPKTHSLFYIPGHYTK